MALRSRLRAARDLWAPNLQCAVNIRVAAMCPHRHPHRLNHSPFPMDSTTSQFRPEKVAKEDVLPPYVAQQSPEEVLAAQAQEHKKRVRRRRCHHFTAFTLLLVAAFHIFGKRRLEVSDLDFVSLYLICIHCLLSFVASVCFQSRHGHHSVRSLRLP